MYNPVECGMQFKEDIQILIQTGQHKDVLLLTDRLLQNAMPNMFLAELHRARAQAYDGLCDWVNALGAWTRVLKIQPKDSEAYIGRGKVREATGDIIGATLDYTRAAEIWSCAAVSGSSIPLPPGTAMWKRIAANYVANKNKASASSRADCPCVKNSKGHNANCRYASACLVCDRAESVCTCAIRMDPSDAQAYLHRAFVRNCRWNQDGSAADCTRAIDLNPLLAEAYCLRGAVYEKLGEAEKAASDRNRAFELRAALV